MEAGCQRLKGHEGAPSSLNEAIDSLRLARGEASLKPAKDVLSSVGIQKGGIGRIPAVVNSRRLQTGGVLDLRSYFLYTA